MRLAAKLVSVLVVVMALLLVVDSYLSLRRQMFLFRSDMQRDADLLGNVLKGLVADAWRLGGQRRAFELIEAANQEDHSVKVRWVWLNERSNRQFRPFAAGEQLERVRIGQQSTVTGWDDQHERSLLTYVPVEIGSTQQGALELRESFSIINQHIRKSIIQTIIVFVALLLVGGLAVVLVGLFFIGRPLQQLTDKAHRISHGDLEGPLKPKAPDEIAALANAMNVMCENLAQAQAQVRAEHNARIETLEHLRHADRLRTVGRLAAGVAS